MEDDNVRTKDFPEDLTPFITQTTLYPEGGGGSGDVWRCDFNYDADGISAPVAVKAFKLPERYDLEKINRKISREIGILKILRHKNIVPLWGIATGFGRRPELRCLVSPWMPNGTLNEYLASNHTDLTPLDRSRMLEDVGAGLRYYGFPSIFSRCSSCNLPLMQVHSFHVMHGDITGANILIDEGGHARLIDFGLSTMTQPIHGQSHLAVTSKHPGAIPYTAPELVLLDELHDLDSVEKADIYSFGCVMLQILSGRPPWSEIKSPRVEIRIVVMITKGHGPRRPDGYPAIIDSDWNFIQKCLQFEPEHRPSADEVLDFVVHRFHSPDSSSRPPDDPSNDAPDDFPRAFPHVGSNDSDTAEHSPDSPPLHPDHQLETLITAMEKLSAPTSNLPAHSTSRILFNYSSGRLNESSTVLAPGVHSLDKPFQCMWDVAHRLHCNALIRGYNISSHLREVHGIHGSDKCRNMCIWNGCNRELKKESLLRHVEEVHLRIVYSCDCGNTYSRRDTLNKHQRSSCTVRQ